MSQDTTRINQLRQQVDEIDKVHDRFSQLYETLFLLSGMVTETLPRNSEDARQLSALVGSLEQARHHALCVSCDALSARIDTRNELFRELAK